jgi:hypothetical protein
MERPRLGAALAAGTVAAALGGTYHCVALVAPAASLSDTLAALELKELLRLGALQRHAPRSVYGLGPPPRRPGGRRTEVWGMDPSEAGAEFGSCRHRWEGKHTEEMQNRPEVRSLGMDWAREGSYAAEVEGWVILQTLSERL